MALAVPQLRYVPRDDYLARERAATTKSEYHDGVIVAMAGASWAHNLIKDNISHCLRTELQSTDCAVVTSDQRVYVEACNKDFYPDVMVVCGEPLFEDGVKDTLTNPAVVFEVLSDTTERFDREDKMDCYGTLESLTDYVLVSQQHPRVERYSRQTDGTWVLTVAAGLQAALALPGLGCRLQLAQVYERVPFATEEAKASVDQQTG